MKKISVLVIIFCSLLTLSCSEDFLEKAPGVDLTEDNIFKNKASLEIFMATVYRYGMHGNFRYRTQGDLPFSGVNNTDCIHGTASISDEGDASEASWINNNRWNDATILPNNILSTEDFRYYLRWIAMRQINLVLKRINEVPDVDEVYKKQVIGEVKFIRALNYMEMLKRYGGVPIIDEVFVPAVPINAPRASFEACVNFILNDLNDAIPDLPARYSASLTGRATSVAAAALKSEVLIYAASPQFNTAAPVLSMSNTADNKLICYGNFDTNRWQLAADAAKSAIELALDNGYGLILEFAPNPLDKNDGTIPLVDGNYRVAWETANNKELILNYQGPGQAGGATTIGEAPMTFWNPTCFGSNWSGITVPLNFIKKYEKLDGTPQTWDAAGGPDVMAKYADLDPRFKQSITYTDAYHTQRDPIAQIWGLTDVPSGSDGKDYFNCLGGVWLRKYIPRNGGSGRVLMNDVIFRVNELYLNYAEALNEAQGPVAEAYTAINTIRNRSGMPNLPLGLTKLQFRERVRNEIAIEMLNDDHRYWDVKRWLIAEEDGVMKGAMQGLKILRTGTASDYKYSWKPYTFETRVFSRKMYLHPFPQAEVLKGNLIQNPGW